MRNWKQFVYCPTWAALVFVVQFVPCLVRAADDPPAVPPSDTKGYIHAAVAADHPLASEAGIEILKQGGNVVDAAVGVAFALSVVRPSSCGIGGGGFMLIWDAEHQREVAIDFRETAPLAATQGMFENAPATLSQRGGKAVAVPNTVRGLRQAHLLFGRLPWSEVLAPAIRLAESGYPADAYDIMVQQEILAEFAAEPERRSEFQALWELYLNGGRLRTIGENITSPQQRVLKMIAEKGADGFHRGPVADSLSATIAGAGGIVTTGDLRMIQPVLREPLVGSYRGHTLHSFPPPSSGGVAVLEILNIFEEIDRRDDSFGDAAADAQSAAFLHAFIEAQRHAFADRSRYMGDPDFVDIPVQRILSRDNARQLAERFDPSGPRPVEHGISALPDDGGTSHFSIIDSDGNAVSCTLTINTYFGSYVVDPTYGVVLNNEMDDFTARPGEPNAFGLIQSERNAVQPRKRPLSSMSPTIATVDGKAVLAVGGSGGPRIISGTAQVLLNVLRFGMTAEEAIAAPRVHHQWLPNRVDHEPSLDAAARDGLAALDYELEAEEYLSACQIVRVTGDCIFAASDPRKGGRPAGY